MKQFNSLVLVLIFSLATHKAFNQTKHVPWQHPIIKAWQNNSGHVTGFTHKKDADYYVPLAILNNNTRHIYYITTFGLIFDSLQLGPDICQLLQKKTVDVFDVYNKIVIVEELKEIEGIKNLLRDKGGKFDKYLPKATHIIYKPLQKAGSTFSKMILLDNYSEQVWQNYYLINTIIENKTDSLFLIKQAYFNNFKPAKLKLRQEKNTVQEIIYTNSNQYSSLGKAVINPFTATVSIFNTANVFVDSFTIKKEKLQQLSIEKIDVFALYRNWLEYELHTRRNLLKEAEKTNSKKFASYGSKDKKTIYNNLAAHCVHTAKKILYTIMPDKDLLLVKTLKDAVNFPRKSFSNKEGWKTISLPPPPITNGRKISFYRGQTEYFLKDHRGNIMATISDKKIPVDENGDGIIDYYRADVITATDYYPFGSVMPGRSYNNGNGVGGKKYGYNGKENDKDIGEGVQDYGMRIYDTRLGRFLSVDPITASYPMLTPYQFASNSPIANIDLDGLEAFYYKNIFGWETSKYLGGPYTEELANKLGYYSATQVHKIEQDKKRDEEAATRRQLRQDAIEAINTIKTLNQPLGIAIEFNPIKGLKDAYTAFDNGEYLAAGLFAVGSFSDLSPLLRATGKQYTMLAKGLAAKYTSEATWKLHNFFRGALIEAKLADSYIAKGFTWMAEVGGKFFSNFDFIDKNGLAISLKTVNAEKNFDFTNIISNIDELANIRGKGIASNGAEYKVTSVQMDIAIPKDYNQTNLQKVTDAAREKGVALRIFEH